MANFAEAAFRHEFERLQADQVGWNRQQMAYLSVGDEEARRLMQRFQDDLPRWPAGL
jgi:hypothetical protein